MKQTYTGGCHCGAVRYEADMDLSLGTLKCNCSMCGKARSWLISVKGEDFRLTSGADTLSRYQFGSHHIDHLFCSKCGIKSFARGKGADGRESCVVVVSCLENVSDADLAGLPVMYIDGRHDHWDKAPAETRHL